MKPNGLRRSTVALGLTVAVAFAGRAAPACPLPGAPCETSVNAPPSTSTPGAPHASSTLYTALLPLVARTDPGPRPLVEVVFEFGQTVRPGADARELAVAFHQLQFIDAAANPLGALTFGTPEANALQGEGWFGNETWPGIGTFQWAGGSAKRAVLRLAAPARTEGVLLRVMAIVDDLSVHVRVDGQLAATMRLDGNWMDGYVPIGPLPPSPAMAPEPHWTAGRYFPRFSAATRFYGLHVRTVLEDWWNQASGTGWRINSSEDTMAALTLVGMQGVINRSGPVVFLDWEDRGGAGRPGEHWWSLLAQQVPGTYLDLDGQNALLFLYRRYAARFQGAVVYDPQVPDTINLATMYAGLEDRVMLAPEQLNLPGMPAFASVLDLRPMVLQQGWNATEDGKYRLYDWVYRNLWPRLEKRVVGVISPGPPTSREISGGIGYYFPVALASRDYIVALRLSALWLSPLDEPQAALFARFVQDAPAPPVVYGFFGNDEVGTTEVASRNGGWCPALTIGNAPLQGGNLSALGGVRPPLQRYPASIDPQRVLATLGSKPVITLWSSDGDNVAFQLEQGFHGGVDFAWAAVQGHRFGWTMNPTLAELAPLVWNDYVTSRSEVSLVSGFSGCGYMYPALMSEGQLNTYLQRAATYLGDTGLRVLHLETRFSALLDALDGRIMGRYYQGLRASGYLGAFIGASGSPWGLGFHYAGTPAPAVPSSYRLGMTNRAAIIQDVLVRRPGEYRVDLTAAYPWQTEGSGYPWKRGEVVPDPDGGLGTSLRFSRGAVAPGLVVWGPFSALSPGTYDVSFRLKVADNGATLPIAQAFVGVQDPAWRFIAQRQVAPNQFAHAGKFQDVALTFTLDQSTPNVEFRLDYYGGMPGSWATTDLFADSIVARRRGSLDLPVMAAVFIPLVGPIEPLPPQLAIAEEFESAGGLVLTPDEFMAALNPEYMLEFAAPRLGTNHPALVQAREYLEQGRYFESLMAVRGGLRGVQ